MSYQALYRKFRPQTFDEVRGQDAVVQTLKNQLKSGRIGHAYLFCGTRGTGKTTMARILARAVNCEHPAEDGSPCNTCDTCRTILSGNSSNVIEIDAASNNGVDNIRQIREEVMYRPTQGRYKVYIIDEVHMLSQSAFNALLKTLEEPPEYVIFIMATTDVNRIPITILSRCQRYNFRRISIDTIADQLKNLLDQEKITAEERAVCYIARAADGSMRDALSLLDQCIAFYLGEELTYEKVLKVLGTVDTDTFSALLRCVVNQDVAGSIRILHELIRAGRDMGHFVTDFTWYIRNLLLVQTTDENLEDVLDVSAENLQQLKEESHMIDTPGLMRYIHILSELSERIRFASQKQILVETTLIRLCIPQMDSDKDSIAERVRLLEQKLENSIVVKDQAAADAGTATSAPSENEEKKTQLRAAAPEDLKKIRARWSRIYAEIDDALIRIALKGSAPSYDAESGGNVLYLTARTSMDRDYIKGHLDEVTKAIADVTGLQVTVQVVLADSDEDRKLAEVPLDDLITSEIDMPVESDAADADEDEF